MRPRFDPWVRKIPWKRKWQHTPVFLPGESHEQRILVGYRPQFRKESDTTEHTVHMRTKLISVQAVWEPVHQGCLRKLAALPLETLRFMTGVLPFLSVEECALSYSPLQIYMEPENCPFPNQANYLISLRPSFLHYKVAPNGRPISQVCLRK